jgi:hypothetical protein
MTLNETNEAETKVLLPNPTPDEIRQMVKRRELVKERAVDSCKFESYRYWLIAPEDIDKWPPIPTPYLLTFRYCLMSEEQRHQEDEALAEFCKQNNIDPNNQENTKSLVSVMLGRRDFYYTTPVLVEITVDENKILQRKIDAHNTTQSRQNRQMQQMQMVQKRQY